MTRIRKTLRQALRLRRTLARRGVVSLSLHTQGRGRVWITGLTPDGRWLEWAPGKASRCAFLDSDQTKPTRAEGRAEWEQRTNPRVWPPWPVRRIPRKGVRWFRVEKGVRI